MVGYLSINHQRVGGGFSALQRAEIAEIPAWYRQTKAPFSSFSALQRAEIAEIGVPEKEHKFSLTPVSVLFNEPKLLKLNSWSQTGLGEQVSVLFNEPKLLKSQTPTLGDAGSGRFQCSSTSRNC